LWALVNNAGVQKGFSVELTGIIEFKDTMEVNAIGLVRVTKAFLPLLRQTKGRVVNVTSLSGRVTMPHLCSYTMSKFAAVAFTECLKQEMQVWGVKVISVEPEMFATPIYDSALKHIDETVASVENHVRADYGKTFLNCLKQWVASARIMSSSKVNIVTDALESAVALEYPDAVYKPCRNLGVRMMWYILENFPRSTVDWLMRCAFSLGLWVLRHRKKLKISHNSD
ncbi:D-beta-hydroxybutyrate dehydrogenase, mitochondrial-like, partial [Stegodyphus dumicola]|uniref:D-beta-hydroxybutyrate dehydrogenase, mitochondrial-like n=1 Tax=Stegodyphus dumicola TaxID=202533 RepID=UPI0015A8A134